MQKIIKRIVLSKKGRKIRFFVGIFIIFLVVVVVGLYFELTEKGCFPLGPYEFSESFFPKQEIIRFLVLGDIGEPGKSLSQVSRVSKIICEKKGCDFALLLGDNFYENGVSSVGDLLFKNVFEDNFSSFNIPFFAVLGNHDVKGNIRAQIEYGEKNPSWIMPDFRYQFTAGPALFSAYNSNCHIFGLFSLNEMLEQESDKWSFVLAHHNIYGVGSHGDIDPLQEWYWSNFLADNVDFALFGHNHHLNLLTKEGQKTTYVISGSGSKNYSDKSARKTSSANSLFDFPGNGFALIEVTPDQTAIEFFDQTGKMLHRFIKAK